MFTMEILNEITNYENHAFLLKQDEKMSTNPEDLKDADRQKIDDYLANNWYSEEDTIYAQEIIAKWDSLPQR